MNKTILIAVMLVLTSYMFAQRHYRNATGSDIQLGTLLSSGDKVAKNYLIRASFFKYNRPYSYLKYSLNYSRMNIRMAGVTESYVNDYTFNFDYARTLKGFYNMNHNQDLFISLIGGAFLGLQRCADFERFKQVNSNPYIYTEYDKNYFICGLQLGLEFEYFLSENIGIVLTGQEQWSPLSDIRKWHTQGTIGVRLIY